VATIRLLRLDRAALVWVSGPLDVTDVPQLRRVLDEVIEVHARVVVVDLVVVPTIDETALSVLAKATTRLGYRGALLQLRLAGGSAIGVRDAPTLRQVLASAYRDRGPAAA
jgi:anti-anti-sigma regulatory factor